MRLARRALGRGFESLLSFNVIIAERGAKFGFPENIFGLFPGMGAYSTVARRVGAAFAEEMMPAGRIYTAEEMKDVGLVHILAEPEQGIAEAREYIQRSKRRHLGSRSVCQVGREVNPISLAELDRIVQVWADALPAIARRRPQGDATACSRAGPVARRAAGGRVGPSVGRGFE